MIQKKINTGKLKIKYVLGNYTTLKDYPTTEDVLYDLIKDYCSKNKKFLKFTDVSLLKKYPTLTKSSVTDIISKLKNNKIIEVVNSTSAYSTYKVITNPYT